jgi:hypothetical protein
MIIIFPILSITLNGHLGTIPHLQTNPSETMPKDLFLPYSIAAPDLAAAVLRTKKWRAGGTRRQMLMGGRCPSSRRL